MKIYYATVIAGERVGEKLVEPIRGLRVHGQKPLGKEIEFCCPLMRDAFGRHLLSVDEYNELLDFLNYFQGLSSREPLEIQVTLKTNGPLLPISHCPFCGEKVVFEADLEVRGCSDLETAKYYYFEKAATTRLPCPAGD